MDQTSQPTQTINWIVYTMEDCPYCDETKQTVQEICKKTGEMYEFTDGPSILAMVTEKMKTTDRPEFSTWPKVFYNGQFLGGNSDLQKYYNLDYKINTNPFDTIGLFTFLRTYSRRHNDKDPKSTIETWDETLTRVVKACNTQLGCDFSKLEQKEVYDLLFNLKGSVAGRFLWQLGTATIDRLGLPSTQNCMEVSTRFWTSTGIKSFSDFKDGDSVIIRGKNDWLPATVKNFGKQELHKLTVKSGEITKEIFTTANHRWIVEMAECKARASASQKALKLVNTIDLCSDQKLASVFDQENCTDQVLTQEEQSRWVVDRVDPTGRVEDVWCVVEPKEECFTLEHGILTKNCAFTVIDEPIKPFVWTMNMLLLGAGVGYRLLPEDLESLPVIKSVKITREDSKDADYIVPDSREGWTKLLGKILKAHFYSGEGFVYSCLLLRSKGAPIKTFGGIASGPDVLCDGMGKINTILNSRAGMKLRPVDALDIMNIIGMIVVSGNIRRCLSRNALLFTSEGLIPIQNAKVGMKVLTSENMYEEVTAVFEQGKQELVRIVTQDGYFDCTPNHRMPVLTSTDDYEWVEAQDLQEDDRLITSRMTIPGTKTCLPPQTVYPKLKHSTTCKPIVVPELDENMAWFIGLFHGDGYVYANHEAVGVGKNNGRRVHPGYNAHVHLVFGLGEYHIASKAKEQLQRFGKTLHIRLIRRKGERSFMVHCQSKMLAWYFHEHVKQPNTSIKIPDYILRGTPEIRLAYVTGACDADGCMESGHCQVISSVYEEFARGLQILLYSCGIESRFVEGKRIASRKDHWQLLHKLSLVSHLAQEKFRKNPTLMKQIGQRTRTSRFANGYPPEFIDEKLRKKYPTKTDNFSIDNFDKDCDSVWCPTKVLRIEPLQGEVDTYDIEVANKHEFFCDGYLTHNSAQIALGDCKDTEYLSAKRWDLGNIPNWRAYSNNSVICNDFAEVANNETFWEGYAGNGEPYGLINLNLHKSCGRIGETQYSDPDVEGVNPCSEQSLCKYETCCLAEIYLPNIKTQAELNKVAGYLYRICKHSLALPCATSKDTEEIVHKNMRMGLGITGYLQATNEQRSWLSPCYEFLREFDKTYSEEHKWPPSIKLTCIKPSGTLSLLGGTTPGIHPGFSRYYKRRVRISSESPLIALAKEHGYHIEYVQNFDGTLDHTTQIASFPVSLPAHTVLACDCSAIEQLEWVKKAQTEWADNSISVTVYYKKSELPAIKEWLAKNYNTYIKSVSFLLHSDHGFQQAPMEAISEAEYLAMKEKCQPIVNMKGICYTEEETDNSAECATGSCPIK